MDIRENKTILRPGKSFSYDYVSLLSQEQIGLHKQSSWELTLILSGSGIRLIGGTSEPFAAGEVVLIPPELPHRWYFNRNGTDGRILNITVTFGDAFLDGCRCSFPELSAFAEGLKNLRDAVKFGRPAAELIASALKEMNFQDDVARLSSLIRLLPLLVDTAGTETVGRMRKEDKTQERLDMVRIYVACNASRSISLDDMVRHVGMNRSAFCAFFRQATGMTFVAYLNEYRIEQACHLLKDRQKPVSDICYSVGFKDIPYFNRIFKKKKGCSPSAYRELDAGLRKQEPGNGRGEESGSL